MPELLLPNELTPQDQDALRILEESLWRSETRFDRDYLERVLAPGFFEFGRSGRVYTRAEILDTPPGEIRCKLPLRNFAIHAVSAEVTLVTYLSEVLYDIWERTNRSSLWRKSEAGWQLCFHQGTPAAEV